MNKQYIFLTMIGIVLYILYLIISFSIEEYKVNNNISELENFILETTYYNKNAIETIEYKQSKAYRNMILKEQQSLKNKWETVVYLTTQQNYNKYTVENDITTTLLDNEIEKEYHITDNMNTSQKWFYYLFKKNQF